MLSRRGGRPDQWLLAVLLALHTIVSIVGVSPGHLSVDEGRYHAMMTNLTRWDSLR